MELLPMDILYKTSNIEISLDQATHILYCTWLGFQDEQSLKDAGLVIHELFVLNKCSKILNDNTNVIGPWNHSTEWTTTQWFPSMIEAGLKKFAWVFSTDVFAQISAYRVTPNIPVVKTFLSKEKALEWLKD